MALLQTRSPEESKNQRIVLPYVSLSTATPRTMKMSRIFWEKATAIQVYCLQGPIDQFVHTN
jgi:hypothetical protein